MVLEPGKKSRYRSMTFQSILFDGTVHDPTKETLEAPEFFADLNLDQVIDAITARRQIYNLKPFFYNPLSDVETIHYRHEIMQDMENITLREKIKAFAQQMIVMRRYLELIGSLYNKYHQEGWFLEAAAEYCQAVTGLEDTLKQINIKSRGLQSFHTYVVNYAASDGFTRLLAETKDLKAALATVKYCVVVKESTVKVRKEEAESDYSQEVEKIFAKFKQGAVKDYRVKSFEMSSMNSVEAQILDRVARLYPEIFADLERFCVQHSQFIDETIRVFDREIQFYIAYLEYIEIVKQAGLKFCYPQISTGDKEIYNQEGFDLALAHKRAADNSSVVVNDFSLEGKERIFIVSGPNQGGKTTFARSFGQLHYLASLGCPIPGKKARLFLFDHIFTHFEKEEDIQNLRGKLQDDLVRISAILDQATPNIIIIMNEIFTSTTLKDAVFLSKKIMARIIELDLLCVWVTFIDELATLSEKTVSMVSTVVPENPVLRTYKIVRKPADGLAYALSIAEKYHLTYGEIKERIKS